MKIKLESAELPETEVIIRGDVTSEEVVSLLQLLKKRNSGKLILYKEEEQYIMDADEIVYVEVSDNKVYAYEKHSASAQHRGDPEGTEKEILQRLDFPQSNGAGASAVAGNGLPPYENTASVCGAAADSLPRSAAHFRNPCTDQRRGCENLVRHLRTHQRVLHAGYIHTYDHGDAEKGIRHRGKFPGRDHVRGG